jgi:hypothetical protein
MTMREIAEELLDRTKREKEGNITGEAQAEEKSIIGLLSALVILLSILRYLFIIAHS